TDQCSSHLAEVLRALEPDDGEEVLDVDMSSPDPPRLQVQRPKPGLPWAPDDVTNPVASVDEIDERDVAAVLPDIITGLVRRERKAAMRDARTMLAQKQRSLDVDGVRIDGRELKQMVAEVFAGCLREIVD